MCRESTNAAASKSIPSVFIALEADLSNAKACSRGFKDYRVQNAKVELLTLAIPLILKIIIND